MAHTAWQISRKKNPCFSTKQKNTLNILGLLCRIEEINIFIILPSIKNSLKILGLLCRFEEINIFIILPSKRKIPKYTGSSLQIWKNKYFYQSTKHKKNFLNIMGLLCRIEKKCAKDDLKKPPWISWVFWASKMKTQDAYLSQGWF